MNAPRTAHLHAVDCQGLTTNFHGTIFASAVERCTNRSEVRLSNHEVVIQKMLWNISYQNFLICSEDVAVHWKHAENGDMQGR